MPKPSLHGRTAVVLTASDRCFAGTQIDRSGPAVAEVLQAAGAEVLAVRVLPDDLPRLTEGLIQAANEVCLVLTTGGTGLSARDNTPEATLAVCRRLVPGLSELICGKALVLNLPGSPAGAVSSLRTVLPLLPHALELLAGQTNH